MSAKNREIAIPEMSLVALVGISGCGKSTFARRHFAPTEVLSSDVCRGLVADDENDQAATKDAFDVLYYIAGKRLAAGRLTVVDATNVQADARRELVAAAREYDMLPVAIVLDLPESVCAERNAQRQDRQFGRHVLRRQHDQLRRSMRSLKREGFRHVWELRTQDEVDAAVVTRAPMLNDLRRETGPFDVIGDVHGCLDELAELLTLLGYQAEHDPAGRLTGASHPQGRKAVFLGDLVDRGPDTPGVLRLVMGMTTAGDALAVAGNHEAKLVRALGGRDVKTGHGLAESLSQLAASDTAEPGFRDAAERFTDGLVSHYVLDAGRLVVAHAGLKEAYHGRASGRVRAFALYGDTTGETDEFGLPIRYPWANDYRGLAMVLYGHTPVPEPEWVNNTMCLDTGCVFGGRLTALRYPERELVSVPARRTYYEPVKPLSAPLAATAGDIPRREPDVLGIGDVLGKRIVHTRHHGRITVAEQNAAAALEVMSRFAVDPRWLVYLPPTMSPVATSQRPGLLEHPAEAFSAYRDAGVDQIICEEKHMGSRCVAVICDSAQTAADRFGVDDGSTGAVYTRTGRPFFTPELTETLLSRLRNALTSAGVFNELSSGWILLDAELLPWSAKAGDLIRDQYAAVGAAARAALPAAINALEQAASTGRDVTALLDRTRARARNSGAFTDAYRRYCWPTAGLDGIKLAPFQLLAAENATFHNRDHRWHLQFADRLAIADPELFVMTRRVVITLTGIRGNQGATEGDGVAGISGGQEVGGFGGEVVVAGGGEVVAAGGGGVVDRLGEQVAGVSGGQAADSSGGSVAGVLGDEAVGAGGGEMVVAGGGGVAGVSGGQGVGGFGGGVVGAGGSEMVVAGGFGVAGRLGGRVVGGSGGSVASALGGEAVGAGGGETGAVRAAGEVGAGGELTVAVGGEAEAIAWWEELTAGGGEGMVVKPLGNHVRGPRGLVQPGLKVRGRDYLRIIYGPDYSDPANLERLRGRNLGAKRSLALREYALGLEALDRLVAGEPLWRVHECVFAVLALESEPVDPRL